MLELLFLLLPIAAVYGWYMGYRSVQENQQEQTDKMSRQYVTGLNLLLSEKSDEAVGHFIELLQIDGNSVNTHLALGDLFCSRGEVDRAIKIHQNLISRANLTIDQKNLVLQQLGKDYMVSGLLDRAERIFEQLLDEPNHKEHALKNLVSIYQQTREWNKAIVHAKSLLKLGKQSMSTNVAYFLCELAVIEQSDNNIEKSIQYLKKALTEDPDCVKASIMLGEIYIKRQDYRKALTYIEKVIGQDIDFISEILPMLSDCYHHLGEEDELYKTLKEVNKEGAGASVELMLSQFTLKNEGLEKAQEELTEKLIKKPTMKGFYHLMGYHLSGAEEGKGKESLNILRGLVGNQLQIKPQYRCSQCGFSSQSLYWHCPSCKMWGKIKPIKGIDGE